MSDEGKRQGKEMEGDREDEGFPVIQPVALITRSLFSSLYSPHRSSLIAHR